MFLWYQVVIFGAILVICDDGVTENVILHPDGDFYFCPGEKVTLNCTVYNNRLIWQCGENKFRYVDCSNMNIFPLECQNATLTLKDPDCNLSSDGTITSTVEFELSTNSTTLTCWTWDMSSNKTKTIPDPVPPVEIIYFSDQIKQTNKVNLRIVNISWQEANIEQNQTYNIAVEPAVQECNTTCVTEDPHKELTVAINTSYSITITTLICNEHLQSAASEPFPILLNVPISVSSCNATPTNDDTLEVQWSSLNDSFHLYYNLTYIVDGVPSSKNISHESCCAYNITEKLVSNISIMGVNDVGSGEEATCHISYPPSSTNFNGMILYSFLGVIPVAVILLCVVTSCVKLRRHNNKAFNKMEYKIENSGIQMEAGRSAFHNDVVYFAAFDSQKCYRYSVSSEEWHPLDEDMPCKNPGLAIIDESVASVGGHINNNPTNEVWVWVLQDRTWKQDKSMAVKRSDPAVVTSNCENYVVAIGGNVYTQVAVPWTPAVEVYYAKRKDEERQWHSVCPLPGIHTGIEATLCNGIIYVIPAEFGIGFKVDLQSLVQPNSNANGNPWKEIKCCPMRFSTPTSLGGHVICCGGTKAKNSGLDHVYMYEDNKDSWKRIGRLPGGGRMYTLAEVCSNKLVVVGGIRELTDKRDGSKRVDRVETITLNKYWGKKSKKPV